MLPMKPDSLNATLAGLGSQVNFAPDPQPLQALKAQPDLKSPTRTNLRPAECF